MTPGLPLAITTGDPGGVGPEISLSVALPAVRAGQSLVVFGDAAYLSRRAIALGASASELLQLPTAGPFDVPEGKLALADVGVSWDTEALSHQATPRGGLAQLRALDFATAAALRGQVRGLVTAPMSKAAVNLAGFAFTGHTEHLAQAAKLADDAVTMMFLGPRLRVALVTTHVAIAALPHEITAARVQRSVLHLAQALVLQAAAAQQSRTLSLVVAGLNPHAGEGGLFGNEELQVVTPALQALAQHPLFTGGQVSLKGPMPAETAFRLAAAGTIDGIVAMMHDQATIASKLLDWGQAVNVTWGLPFVRTSVDHGVAYDAAASGDIDDEGMRSALQLAEQLTHAPLRS